MTLNVQSVEEERKNPMFPVCLRDSISDSDRRYRYKFHIDVVV